MAIVCMITSTVRGYPYEVAVPPDLLPLKKEWGRVSSVIIADSVQDRLTIANARRNLYPALRSESLVEEVLDRLLTALEEH